MLWKIKDCYSDKLIEVNFDVIDIEFYGCIYLWLIESLSVCIGLVILFLSFCDYFRVFVIWGMFLLIGGVSLLFVNCIWLLNIILVSFSFFLYIFSRMGYLYLKFAWISGRFNRELK